MGEKTLELGLQREELCHTGATLIVRHCFRGRGNASCTFLYLFFSAVNPYKKAVGKIGTQTKCWAHEHFLTGSPGGSKKKKKKTQLYLEGLLYHITPFTPFKITTTLYGNARTTLQGNTRTVWGQNLHLTLLYRAVYQVLYCGRSENNTSAV